MGKRGLTQRESVAMLKLFTLLLILGFIATIIQTIIGMLEFVFTTAYGLITLAFLLPITVLIVLIIQKDRFIREQKRLQIIKREEDRKTQLFDEAFDVINRYKKELAIDFSKRMHFDSYGKQRVSNWTSQGRDYFFENVLLEEVSDPGFFKNEYNKRIVLDEITNIARNNENCFSEQSSFSEVMTGRDFELFCFRELQRNGWDVQITKASGDQGVDLLAQKDSIIVAIQCKKYAKSVGNAAIQEIIAGKNYYKANIAAVVTNSEFTISAKKLALSNNVLLLHYLQLDDLELFVRMVC